MPDEKVEVLIELLKKGQGATEAANDLEKLDRATQKSSASFANLGRDAKAAFAVLGGTALLRSALNEFVESERAVSRLNAALRSSGQFSDGYSKQLQALAKSFQDVTTYTDEAALNIISKLIAFGAPRESVEQLTEAVLDFSTLLDKDVPRATLAMGKALQGEFGAFTQMGFKVDEAATSTKNFNSILDQLNDKAGGQARAAAASLGGQIENTSKGIKELTETLGGWISTAIVGFGKVAQAIGQISVEVSPTTIKARQDQLKSNDQLRRSLEKEIDGLGGETSRDFLRGILNKGFTPKEKKIPTMTDTGGVTTVSERDAEAERTALRQVSQFIRPDILPKNTERAKVQIQTEEMRRQEATKMEAYMIAVWEEELQREKQLQEEIQRGFDDEQKRIMENFVQQQQVNQEEKAMVDDLTLVKLSGLDRELATARINHEQRVAQIQKLKFEDEDRYIRLMELEGKLYAEEQKRIQASETSYDRVKDKVGEIGISLDYVVERASSGLAEAFLETFEGAEDAFKKFAATFFREMAKMILQLLIARTLKAAIGGVGGLLGANGLQAPRMAANGVAGVSEVNRATYFPNFNVIAGEAGREVMTVMARPRLMEFGGISAHVGDVGNQKLAIVNAHALARKFGQGGTAGGGGGMTFTGGGGSNGDGPTEVVIKLPPHWEADIVRKGARAGKIEVLNDLNRDTPIAAATKRLSA